MFSSRCVNSSRMTSSLSCGGGLSTLWISFSHMAIVLVKSWKCLSSLPEVLPLFLLIWVQTVLQIQSRRFAGVWGVVEGSEQIWASFAHFGFSEHLILAIAARLLGRAAEKVRPFQPRSLSVYEAVRIPVFRTTTRQYTRCLLDLISQHLLIPIVMPPREPQGHRTTVAWEIAFISLNWASQSSRWKLQIHKSTLTCTIGFRLFRVQ